MVSECAIEVRDIRKSYGREDALKGINLSIEWGEIYGFLGPNGAGKSTLIQILTTLLLPSSGRAMVVGFDVVNHPDEVRRTIGVALQDTGIDPMLTAQELLVLQGRLYGFSNRAAKARTSELLQEFGLAEVAAKRIKTFSGGMRRRLDLALALVHRPKILFLDEPTTGLDPTNRIALWKLLRDVQTKTGVTVFLTTQYLEEADELCQRVGIIDRGLIIAEDTPRELKKRLQRDVIVLGTSSAGDRDRLYETLRPSYDARIVGDTVHVFTSYGAAAAADILQVVQGLEVELSSLQVAAPTLDDVFLELTGGLNE